MSTARCNRFVEDVAGLFEGTASEALRVHVASCDACRDRAHALEQVSARIAKAGDDFFLQPPLAARLAAIVEEAARVPGVVRSAEEASAGERISETRVKTEVVTVPRSSRRARWLLLAACASIGASSYTGLRLADRDRSPTAAATRAWHGKVAKIAKSGADKAAAEGLTVVTPAGRVPLDEGAEVKAGMHLATDGKTRAKVAFDDGSWLILDRATDVSIDAAPRTVSVTEGSLLAEVAHVEKAPPAKVNTANGEVSVLGTMLSVTAAPDRTNVEVLRGEVEVATAADKHRVSAGQEGVVGKDGKVDVAPANDLAQRAAFGEQLIAHNEDADAPASGLGELRARRPGKTDEKDRAVHLAKHSVKVRIAGAVARTEIDETFANDTDEELEGIYRFPLPPGAQIERLALEVDGTLLDGEFVDRAKGAAIWRGAIQNAAPKAPKPREEIVWVPGPWHDPALLEWQRGGRFELRIFPIPKRGSRRVVIAYTETVAPVSGVRRYVYPLPQGSSSNITIDQFALDAQVVGHDGKTPVRVRGYELDRKHDGAAERLSTALRGFNPSGDLAIEYSLDDKATDATAWAYRPEPRASIADRSKKAKEDPIGDDPFVAIALRPKLPKWSESKPRDQVIVVDAGRSMYGERLARAKRLAVQLTQEMDRRDRVTVLACDVSCRALPGGFVAPGAPSAHDVDAFLQAQSADGASDLVAAVRSAAKVTGHDGARDLRIVLLSDGVATAGYRSAARVATEVSDAIADKRSSVVSVPIGADADTNLLADVARGGGGVVVPYQPGQRLEATALEVLNATYGTTLRDVEVVLPEGLRDTAPAAIAPLRAGGETIVTARMASDFTRGDVVVRGKVGGDPFEAKYPIEIRATTDAANAFVPRLYAAARIADREREPGDAARAELVSLSRRFAVPAKATSLLVLESEAMFKAFGIERAEHGARWTGESVAQGQTVATIEKADLTAGLDPFEARGEFEEAKKDKAPHADEQALGGGLGRASGSAAGPAMTQAPAAAAPPAKRPAPADVDSSRKAESLANGFDDRDMSARRRARPRGGQFMKRVFVRHATLTADGTAPVAADKLAQARAAVAAAPDERAKHKELAKLLALSGQIEELGETLEKWSARDPLDLDVIAGRSDVAARRGDREGALRILGGSLAASALSAADAFVIAQTVGRSYERLAKEEACAFYVTAAELKSEPAAIARAISCERAQGRLASAERWLIGLKDTQRSAVVAALSKLEGQKGEGSNGDVVVSASWSGGADLDIALVDPAGRRASAVSRMKGTRVEGALSRDHETLALSSNDAGSFVIEVARANASESTVPATGTITVRAFGQTQTLPFTIGGPRVQVGRADVRWEAELVPISPDDPIGRFDSPIATTPPFDRAAAATALAMVQVSQCGASGQVGTGHVTVTFGPSGRVSDVVVDDANFSGTPAGRCVRSAFMSAVVPAFSGQPAVRIGKSFVINGR